MLDSLAKAAKTADVHFQTLSKYEKDSSDIPFSLLNELSNLYQVPINNIFGRRVRFNPYHK